MDKLYHYTSIETLYNMLEKSIITDNDTKVQYLNMWATHIKYLNDETERDLFTDALKKEVCEYTKKSAVPLNDKQLKELDNLCDVDSYIISLSELQDDLNMWRGYGGNGIGANLEFDFHAIPAFYSTKRNNQYKTEHVYRTMKCNYFLPNEFEIDESLTKRISHYLLSERKKNSLDADEIKIMRDVRDLATVSKHAAYKSEKEWRFVCSPCSIPKHIFSNGIIKPYIEFPIPLSSITSITIGPCIRGEHNTESIVRFIRDTLRANFDIRYSTIPYRR